MINNLVPGFQVAMIELTEVGDCGDVLPTIKVRPATIVDCRLFK
jgi:hypothetical protein